MTSLLILLGGVWRVVDGESWLPKIVRQIALLALIVYSLYLSSADTWLQYILMTAAIWWNIEKGYTDWLDPVEMFIKYLPVGLVGLVAIGGPASIFYILACMLCGLAYPLLDALKMPRYDFYARFIVGATVLGGLHLL